MNKNKFKIGDLVDIVPELKKYATEDIGLAIIVNIITTDMNRAKFYTLLWSNGETSKILEKNIQLAG